MMGHTYTIEIRHGWSAYDHLAPIITRYSHDYLASARRALEQGRRAQGDCERRSRRVRVDILRSDGHRFEWE